MQKRGAFSGIASPAIWARVLREELRRMNIQVAVLCDAATDEHGKLNLLGAFDTIYTQQLPAVHPQCSIALRVTFAHQDEGNHQLRLNFVDADGRSIMPGNIE